jgi:hypothetical protein
MNDFDTVEEYLDTVLTVRSDIFIFTVKNSYCYS